MARFLYPFQFEYRLINRSYWLTSFDTELFGLALAVMVPLIGTCSGTATVVLNFILFSQWPHKECQGCIAELNPMASSLGIAQSEMASLSSSYRIHRVRTYRWSSPRSTRVNLRCNDQEHDDLKIRSRGDHYGSILSSSCARTSIVTTNTKHVFSMG